MPEPMKVRELIAELRRYDDDALIMLDGRLVTDVGRRERPGAGVHPQLYATDPAPSTTEADS